MVLTFEFVDEILPCEVKATEQYFFYGTVWDFGTVYDFLQGDSYF